MRLFGRRDPEMVEPPSALPGRGEELRVPTLHEVLGTPLKGPFPGGIRTAIFGMGCFWGAERMFWQAEGVYTTAVGYAGGFTPNPTYEEVCSGMTGHAEVVLVGYDVSPDQLRGDAEDLLGGPRPHPGDAPGQRRRHPVPLAAAVAGRGPAATPPRPPGQTYQERLTRRRHGRRSRPSSPPPTPSTPSTTPRPTTSSTSPRTPAGTVRTTRRASPARSGWAVSTGPVSEGAESVES